MKFYITNELLDAQIKEIKQQIKLSMNGVVADAMKSKGVNYKQNFGVELSVLRQIASKYSATMDISNRLWLLGGRETMILSLLLTPVEQMSVAVLIERINSIEQKEMLDVASLFLLSQFDDVNGLIINFLQQNTENCTVVSFMLVARVYNRLNDEVIALLISKCIEYSTVENYNLFSSIAVCLGRLCRINNNVRREIQTLLFEFENSDQYSKRYIVSEVKQELDFLTEL